MDKPIHFTNHARERMVLRGASTDEVVEAIRGGTKREARRSKSQSRLIFPFDNFSPVNGKWYQNKTVEALYADEENAIVVLSVKVYYH